MRYTEVEIRPSYNQIVYWSERAVYDWYLSLGYTPEEMWELGLYTGPRTALLHTGKYENNVWIEGLDIHFDIGKRKDEETEKGELKVWNLSSDVLRCIQVGCIVTVRSGYTEHYDTVFIGEISKVNTKREEGDMLTTINMFGSGKHSTDVQTWGVLFNSTDKFPALFDEILLNTGLTAVYLGLEDVIYDEICVEGMGIQHEYDIGIGVEQQSTIPAGPGVSLQQYKLKELLDKAMEQTDNYFYWSVCNSRIYFIRKGYSLPAFVRLTPLTGLLEYKSSPSETENSPVYDEEDTDVTSQSTLDLYEVKSILIYDIAPNGLIVIQPSLTGDSFIYRIRECDYKSDDAEHVVEFVAEKLYVYNQAPVYENSGAGGTV